VTNVTHRARTSDEDRAVLHEGEDVKPNFDSPLNLDRDNRRVDATGPLDWQGATGQCRVVVTITQTVNGTTVVATGDSGNYNAPEPTWDANADTEHHEQLQPGSAHAEGVLTLTDPPRPEIRWSEDVQLQARS
jgi:hypothetical protein